MPYIQPKVIQEAKKMDLLTYLKNYEPYELMHVSGNTYCTRTHDSLKISNGKWCWWSRGIGGKSALDYLIKVKDYSFLEAVETIMGQAAIQPPVFMPAKEKIKKSLLLPPRHDNADTVTTYLTGRGIDEEIVRFCINTNRIYESHSQSKTNDKVHINAVFIGFDNDCNPRYASLRGVGTDFKGEATGSDKYYSFSMPASYANDTVHLFESAIDLLSYATILKLEGRDYSRENLLSLAGVYQPKKQIEESKVPAALTQFLQNYPHVKKVVLHLDNDYVGRLAAKAIMTVLPKQYVSQTFVFSRHKDIKDMNDCLCLRLGLNTTKAKKRSCSTAPTQRKNDYER